MVDLAHEPDFDVGAMHVDPALRVVSGNSLVQSVEPRVMQVLVELARHRGRVLSRHDLIDSCWGGRIVGDEALNRCIAAIRRLSEAFGGFAITTIPRVGYRLDEQTVDVSADRAVQHSPRPRPAERRQLTALYCSLIRPSGAIVNLDPEDWHAIVALFRRTATYAIERLGGYSTPGQGDVLQAYFGYPRSLEDGAERAVHAGLAIVRAMSDLNAAILAAHGVEISVRVGLHAGVVVVADDGVGGVDIFGEAPDIAALAQADVARDTVVMTAAVNGLVVGLFTLAPHEGLRLDGVTEPLPRYRAVSAGQVSGRRLSARDLAPFIGREDEMRFLDQRMERTLAGQGQVVLVMGEPGIGKTRLIAEFKTRMPDAPHVRLECAGALLFANTSFYAVIQLLRAALGWQDNALPEDAFVQLDEELSAAGARTDEALALTADLLGVTIPSGHPPLMLAPDQRRRRLFAVIVEWLLGKARRQPLVLMIEDLQWIDPSTLELIHVLAGQTVMSPITLVCTARPEFRSPWPVRANHSQISLDRLSTDETRRLVAGVVASASLAEILTSAVVERADGVPLFAMELARLVLDRQSRDDAPRFGSNEIPATLRDSLAARLDQLGEAAQVAQIGAVLGREFSYALLEAVADLSTEELGSALAKLAEADLILRSGLQKDATFRFRHALIQDAAYGALVKPRRLALHARVARAIAERFPAMAAAQPETLARHWAAAGKVANAIGEWAKASEAARARQAYREAEHGYREALALMLQLPETPDRDAQEMELASSLGGILHILHGEASSEAVAVLARCQSLAERQGNRARLIAALLQACSQTMVAGNFRDAALLSDRLLELAKEDGDEASLCAAHQSRFLTLYLRGELIEAEAHFEDWKALWQASGEALEYRVRDAFCYGALRAWTLGHLDLALERVTQAGAYAAKTGNPIEIAAARMYEGVLHAVMRDANAAEESSRLALAMCEDLGAAVPGGICQIVLGWSRAHRGEPGEGVALMRQGLAELVRADQRMIMPAMLTMLAEAQLQETGHEHDALETIEHALAYNLEERAYRPFGLSTRAEAWLRLGEAERAETGFMESIALAQETNAKTLELRAAIGLARLLQARGESTRARDLLLPIYSCFTDGFDTFDVKDAKTLLDDMSLLQADPHRQPVAR